VGWKDARIVSASEEVRARRSMESCTIQMNGDIIMNMMVASGDRKEVLSRLVAWAPLQNVFLIFTTMKMTSSISHSASLAAV
jgi:hypothetical protein